MNRLKQIRENRGKTQFDLGRAIGIQPQKISDFENERRDLRLHEAKRIADFLNISLDELIGKSGLASSGDNASKSK